MKMIKTILLILVLPFLVNGQSRKENVGIHFENKIFNWESVVAKATTENKYIFVDCFTTWCKPCKEMTRDVFSKKKVGNFFNKTFVNIAFQVDSTRNDKREVIATRNMFKNLVDSCKINCYPTYLIFDKTGRLVHKFCTEKSEEDLIVKASEGLIKNKQYYTLINEYKNGNDSLLTNICRMADRVSDNVDGYLQKFIDKQQNLYTKDNAVFLLEFMNGTEGLVFKNFYANKEKWASVLSKQQVDEELEGAICSALETKLLFMEQGEINWQTLTQQYSKAFPAYGKVVVAKEAMYWKLRNNDFEGYLVMLENLMLEFPEQMNYPNELNGNAMTVFTLSNSKAILNKALSWSKKSLEQEQKPEYLDTYANILYKLGSVKEAIEYEKKAIALLKNEKEKKSYQEVLSKMKNGEPTWK